MGHANTVKYLLLAVMAFHFIGFLTGCKPDAEAEARKVGRDLTRDSPGWERLRQQEAEKQGRGGSPTALNGLEQ